MSVPVRPRLRVQTKADNHMIVSLCLYTLRHIICREIQIKHLQKTTNGHIANFNQHLSAPRNTEREDSTIRHIGYRDGT